MIGILGGMGTQAGLDFCNKLAVLNRGKIDQKYPLFILYNKSNIPKRPENLKKYFNVLKGLVVGCNLLQKNKCKFIVIPCNTAHYWYNDLQKKIKIPIINMPKEVYLHTKKNCKKNSKIGILATEGTLKTNVYNKFFHKNFFLVSPKKSLQIKSVNKAIKCVKMGKIKNAEKAIKPAIPASPNCPIKEPIPAITLNGSLNKIPIATPKAIRAFKTSVILLSQPVIKTNAFFMY